MVFLNKASGACLLISIVMFFPNFLCTVIRNEARYEHKQGRHGSHAARIMAHHEERRRHQPRLHAAVYGVQRELTAPLKVYLSI